LLDRKWSVAIVQQQEVAASRTFTVCRFSSPLAWPCPISSLHPLPPVARRRLRRRSPGRNSAGKRIPVTRCAPRSSMNDGAVHAPIERTVARMGLDLKPGCDGYLRLARRAGGHSSRCARRTSSASTASTRAIRAWRPSPDRQIPWSNSMI